MSKKTLCLCAGILVGAFGFALSTQAKEVMMHSTLIEDPALTEQAATEECAKRINQMMKEPVGNAEVAVKKEGTVGWRCTSNPTHLAHETEKVRK